MHTSGVQDCHCNGDVIATKTTPLLALSADPEPNESIFVVAHSPWPFRHMEKIPLAAAPHALRMAARALSTSSSPDSTSPHCLLQEPGRHVPMRQTESPTPDAMCDSSGHFARSSKSIQLPCVKVRLWRQGIRITLTVSVVQRAGRNGRMA